MLDPDNKGSPMIRILPVSVLAVAAAGAFGLWFAHSPADAPDDMAVAPAAYAPMAAMAQSAPEIDISTVREMVLGAEDAPVTIVEYASFTCPHCADFHEDVLPRLKADYIDSGQVRLVHREVYFDRYGLWAAMVARCDGGDRYFGIADMIYARQRDWSRGEPAEVVQALANIGASAGLTREALDACLSDGEKAQTLVAWYQENATADEIEATPSFIINGEKYANMPYDDLRAVLDQKLAD
jgi:protein-disulfide isomerase